MPSVKQIGNPAGAFGATADPQEQVIAICVNNSGGTLVEGDLVICTDVAGINVTTTTTASDTAVLGVVGPASAIGTSATAASSTSTYAASAIIPIITAGPARVNIAANTVAAKDVVASSTAAKVAAKPATAGSVGALQALVGSFIAVAQESQAAKDANSTIRCIIIRA